VKDENAAWEARQIGWYGDADESLLTSFRADDDGNLTAVAGVAAVFNERSIPLGGFVEELTRDAFDGCDMTQCVCTPDHRYTSDAIMGRAGVNLELSVTDRGLEYVCTPAADNRGWRDLMPLLRDGVVVQSSFAFRVAPGGADWSEDEETGAYVRTVTKIAKLYDVAPVVFPAYPQTEAGARSTRAAVAQLEQWRNVAAARSESDLRRIAARDHDLIVLRSAVRLTSPRMPGVPDESSPDRGAAPRADERNATT
jgi:HK97 family phage prohead protease